MTSVELLTMATPVVVLRILLQMRVHTLAIVGNAHIDPSVLPLEAIALTALLRILCVLGLSIIDESNFLPKRTKKS